MSTHVHRRTALVLASSLGLSMSALVLAPAAHAGCAPETYYATKQVGGGTHVATGGIIGKYNSSDSPSKLTYTMSESTTKSSSLSAGAKVTMDWMITKVEASFNVTVTKATTKSTTISNDMIVNPKSYGYMNVGVEYRTYTTTKYTDTSACGTVSEVMGTIKAIVVDPFFMECQSTTSGGCTPK